MEGSRAGLGAEGNRAELGNEGEGRSGSGATAPDSVAKGAEQRSVAPTRRRPGRGGVVEAGEEVVAMARWGDYDG
jgi:hypothetical protein